MEYSLDGYKGNWCLGPHQVHVSLSLTLVLLEIIDSRHATKIFTAVSPLLMYPTTHQKTSEVWVPVQ